MKYKKQEKSNKTLKKITKNNQKTKRNKSKKFGGSTNKSLLNDPFAQKNLAIHESDDEQMAKKLHNTLNKKSNSKPPYNYNKNSNKNSNLVINESNNLKNTSDNVRKSQSNLFVNHKTGGIILLVGIVGGLASVILANQ